MKKLYRIKVANNAPRLVIDSESPYAHKFLTFDGTPKSLLSPNKEFLASPEVERSWQQIYSVAPGSFALSEIAWEECEDMYYVLSMGNELLAAGNSKHNFRIVNPLDFAPRSGDTSKPFDFESFKAPIFRLKTCDPTEIFCFSGSSVPGDEFKHCYDEFGFTGLEFEEIWTE